MTKLQVAILSSKNRYTILLLLGIAIIILVANYIGKDYAMLSTNLVGLAITAPLVAFSFIILIKDGTRGDFGKAWVFFFLFVVLWFIAEQIWLVYEIVYNVDPWPSEADYFWMAGFFAYFVFCAFYLRPFKKMIPPSLVVVAIGFTVALSGAFVYQTLSENEPSYENLLNLSYTVLDTVSLGPIFISLVLFFRGQVSFLWTSLFVGMLCFVFADYGFLFLTLDDSYYTGHPIDIPYMWGYGFFLVGVLSYYHVFKKRSIHTRYNNQETLR